MCQSCINLVHGIVLQEQWIWAIYDNILLTDSQVLKKKHLKG